MLEIDADDPLTVAVVEAIHVRDVETLERLLRDPTGLAGARIRSGTEPG